MSILSNSEASNKPQPSIEEQLRLATEPNLNEVKRRKLRGTLGQVWRRARFLWAIWRDRRQVAAQLREVRQ